MPVLNEWNLIERLKKGDEAAFKEIVESSQGLVYNTALGIVQNPEDAEDVTQEVFVQVFRKLDTFRGESAFTKWLHRLTINHVLMHFR